MYRKNRTAKILAVIGLAALAAIAAWQFYLFVVFKDAQGAVDVQGGTLHLWLAVGIALLVCVGGLFLFLGVLQYDKRDEIHITSPGQSLGTGRFRKDLL